MMNRRDLLLAATSALGGVMIGTSMLRALAGDAPAAQASRAIFSTAQSQAVSALAEMIIPQTDTPGAVAAGTPAFIEAMVADWYTDTERKIFFASLETLDAFCRASAGSDFLGASEEQRATALSDAERQASSYASPLSGGFFDVMLKRIDENTPFFTKLKELTVVGYFSSEVGAQQELSYNPMPMRYDGDYDYAQTGRQWSY